MVMIMVIKRIMDEHSMSDTVSWALLRHQLEKFCQPMQLLNDNNEIVIE